MTKLFSFKPWSMLYVLALLSLIGLTGCSDDKDPEHLFIQLTTETLDISVDDKVAIDITSGNGGYIVNSSHPDVATAEIEADKLTIVAVSEGTSLVTLRDRKNQQLEFKVNVSYKIVSLTVDNESVDLFVGESATVNITSGNGEYTIASSDESIAEASVSGTEITIIGIGEGDAELTLNDKAGVPVKLSVRVVDKASILVGTTWKDGTANPVAKTDYEPATEAIIKNINSNSMLGLLGTAALKFNAGGKFRMGIFANGDWRIEGDHIILSNVKGFIKDYLKGDVLIPIKGDLETMESFDLPMDQTETFNAEKMQEIADEYGDPKIADAKVEYVIININLKREVLE